jgi:hypothetical protein
MEAARCGMPYVDQRWLGGMLTNFKTVKTSLKLKDMQAQKDSGAEMRIKKEALLFDRELAKLEKDIGGIQDMGALPDAIFVIDVGFHKIAVAEAKKLGIPVVGVVDTNHSPEGIDYVIPGNDDSAKAVACTPRPWLTPCWKARPTPPPSWCRPWPPTVTNSSKSAKKPEQAHRASDQGAATAPFSHPETISD